jgi:hypothetical protein
MHIHGNRAAEGLRPPPHLRYRERTWDTAAVASQTRSSGTTRRVPMSRADREEIRARLQSRDLDAIVAWSTEQPRALQTLLSLAFDPDALTRWRAIEALGRIAAARAEHDLERIRVVLRHLFWSMNDESGNIGWYAPEAIGEILFNVPALTDEFGGMLPAFMREEPFERGTHWAMMRLAAVHPELFRDSIEKLTESIKDPDPLIRAAAGALLALLGAGRGDERLRDLLSDQAAVTLYDFETGLLRETTVGTMVRGALRSGAS